MVTALALAAGGADVVVYDDNPERVAQAREAGLSTGDFRDAGLHHYSALVLSPGVPFTHPKPHWSVDLAREADIPVIGDIELFVRERDAIAPDCSFVAITGTNGKSTTTALISHILGEAGRDVQMGGNIGKAILSLESPSPNRVYVIECSSYQIDLAPSIDPTIGILLNLSADHLDRHGTMDNYAEIKERLVAASDVAIIGTDDNYTAAIGSYLKAKGKTVISIATSAPLAGGIYLDHRRLVEARGGMLETVADLDDAIALRGAHNGQNAAAAWAACRQLGLSEDEINAGFQSFPGLAHRMEPVLQRGNVTFVNDSKATNADAAAMALSSFNRIYWIAGGLAKDNGIEQLRPYFDRIAKAYLVGEAAPQFAATLGNTVPYEIAGTIKSAVGRAAHDSAEDDYDELAVLLSPACASFDQFANFERRGDAFRNAVLALDELPITKEQTQ